MKSRKFKLPLTLVALMAAVTTAHAQYEAQGIVEPQMLRLQISDVSFGLRVEAEREQTKFVTSGQTSSYERDFLGPDFNFGAVGSVYHPNFMEFSFGGELWPGYSIQKTASSTTSSTQKQIQLQGNYSADFRFLEEKPYRFDLFYNQNYSYREMDFFNRVQVIGSQYGGNFGYQAGPLPFNIRVSQHNEQTFGLTTDTTLQDTNLGFDTRNKRNSGESTFNYTFSDSNRTYANVQGSNAANSVGVGDSESFGSTKQIQLANSASYSTNQTSDGPTTNLNASTNLSIEHSPTLSSIYELNYTRATTQGLGVTDETDNFNGDISLRHQLYKSLTSILRLEGQDLSSNGSVTDENGVNTPSQTKTTNYGVGVNEQYVKRLGTFGVLSLAGSIMVDHTVVNNGGNTLIIINESHTFTPGGTATISLNTPNVDQSSIVITDEKGDLPAYQNVTDYTVSTNGFVTMIQRTPVSMMPSTVWVSYRAQPAALGSGAYDTVNQLGDMRVDLWNGLLAVYGRINMLQNNAPAAMLIPNMTTRSLGADTTWRWLHASAEYETSDSNLSSYQSIRLSQSVSTRLNGAARLSLNLTESQAKYINSGLTEQDYSVITRYQRGRVQLDAGYSVRKGNGADQTEATVRPGFEFNFGEIAVKIGYSFEYGNYQGSTETQRQSLFIDARRKF